MKSTEIRLESKENNKSLESDQIGMYSDTSSKQEFKDFSPVHILASESFVDLNQTEKFLVSDSPDYVMAAESVVDFNDKDSVLDCNDPNQNEQTDSTVNISTIFSDQLTALYPLIFIHFIMILFIKANETSVDR